MCIPTSLGTSRALVEEKNPPFVNAITISTTTPITNAPATPKRIGIIGDFFSSSSLAALASTAGFAFSALTAPKWRVGISSLFKYL